MNSKILGAFLLSLIIYSSWEDEETSLGKYRKGQERKEKADCLANRIQEMLVNIAEIPSKIEPNYQWPADFERISDFMTNLRRKCDGDTVTKDLGKPLEKLLKKYRSKIFKKYEEWLEDYDRRFYRTYNHSWISGGLTRAFCIYYRDSLKICKIRINSLPAYDYIKQWANECGFYNPTPENELSANKDYHDDSYIIVE